MANSDYLRNLIMRRTFLDAEALPGLYIGLNSDDPGSDGANELSGYQRQSVTFGTAGIGRVSNRDALQFDDLPAATITHFSVWDAEQEGRFLTGGKLDVGQMVPAGHTLIWRAGDLILNIP